MNGGIYTMESYKDFLNRVNAFETPTFEIALEDMLSGEIDKKTFV